MRRYLPFLIIAGLGIIYLWKQNKETPRAEIKRPAAAAQQTPEPRKVYEHDWAKHSIDRAREVMQKARAQTKESQEQPNR
jgi:hypothetical protein